MITGQSLLIFTCLMLAAFVFGCVIGWCIREENADD